MNTNKTILAAVILGISIAIAAWFLRPPRYQYIESRYRVLDRHTGELHKP